ncbi:DUF167 family protein [Arvimicrobium flavum]|uniref:DUF167 family protein n=1 Tax=Arvimicrobium flavum TaxID=3393320 RepID=UPI00237B437E|nr:DUF167 family protein [Mesorhizobium shangrilense]
MDPFRAEADGLAIFVRLTPRSSRDAVMGVEQTADGRAHVAARVRAVPEKGAANAALEKVIGDWLSVPRSAVRVAAGATARLKTVRVDGNPTALAEALRARLAAQ